MTFLNQKYIIFPLGGIVLCFKDVKGNFIEKTKKEFLDDNNNDNDINNFDMIIETNFKKGKKFKLNE